MLGPLLAAALVVAVLTGYATRQASGWAQRDITSTLGWPVTYLTATGAALGSVPFTAPAWGSGPAVAAAAFVWLAVLAVSTDLASRKVPWDIFHPVAALGLVLFAANYTIEGLLALGTGLVGAVGLPLVVRALTNRGLGMSDVRLLWAATATCGWWAGQTWLLYALIGACFLQVLVRVVAVPLNLGDLVPVPTPAASSPKHAASTSASGPAPEATNTEATEADGRAPVEAEPVRMRRELPFAPALVLALLGCLGYATATGYGACAMWNLTGVC